MSSEMKVEVIHQEIVQPSSPTPSHLRSAYLSFFDQFMPECHVPLLLFYPNNTNRDEINIDHHSLVAQRSKLLKTSLSETLTHFHPFAGRIQDNISISCNDQGAAFIEARVNCPISTILVKPDLGMLNELIVDGSIQREEVCGTSYLLVVQVSYFECGGVAIGVNFSHKIMDAYTLNTFLNSWAAIALGSRNATTDHVVHHHLPDAADQFGAAATVFPPLDFLKFNSSTAVKFTPKDKCVIRRFVFNTSKIAALKSRSASATVPNPTRVEVVSSLIWKCLMEASRANSGCIRPSVWCQSVNMRKVLLAHEQRKNLMGNLVVKIFAEKTEAEGDDLQSLVCKLRKTVEENKAKYGSGVISGEDVCQLWREYVELMQKRDDIDSYGCTSWCRFQYYGADFGWGKPSWICVPGASQFKNMIVFMDTRDGDGLEARLTLNEEDMALMESNEELLAYASLNPTVI
ncbi:hypothetical protein M0R45_024507 [Rubus argutus]|uniref:Uncharacterized protein n=1 Tax=Rubus argutus TaxID=59490 RepID=A0AAW1WT94_RUBAR